MTADWKLFDHLQIPLLITDKSGCMLYKNDLAKKMQGFRMGSQMTGKMDPASKAKFLSMTDKGCVLSLRLARVGGENERCLAFPFRKDGEEYAALLFVYFMLGDRRDADSERVMLNTVPCLQKMLAAEAKPPHTLAPSMRRPVVRAKLSLLIRRMLSVYFNVEPADEEAMPVTVSYFVSLLSYFFREVFVHQGLTVVMSRTAAESAFRFLDHKKLTAMLLMMIELLIDRANSPYIYVDLYEEAEQAVISFSAQLGDSWVKPDESMPDSYILFSILRQNGIDHEFYNTTMDGKGYMVCRLFLPARIAQPSSVVYCGKEELAMHIIDFMDYLQNG